MQILPLIYLFLFGLYRVQASEDLPFKTINLDLKSTYNGHLFYTQIGVGPPGRQQSFNLLASTAFGMTWIPSLEISPTRGFQNTSSDHYVDQTRYMDISGSGHLGYEYINHINSVQVGPQLVEGLLFGVASPRKLAPTGQGHRYFSGESQLDGMLGLGATDQGDNNILQELFDSKFIDHVCYSIFINNTAVANRDNVDEPIGALVLGGFDRRYYSGDFHYVKMDQTRHVLRHINRSVILTSVQLDWSRTNQEKSSPLSGVVDFDLPSIDSPSKVRLDSSTISFVGDKRLLDRAHLDIIGAKLIHEKLYAFDDCRLDNKPDFVFTLMGVGGQPDFQVKITPEEYLIEHRIADRLVCLSAFMPESNIDYWIFGTRFLRKFYTVFDYEIDVVGFATPTT